MILEDFFTLTEMKDGLTAPSRVKELLSVMQKEKDYVIKNASDVSRQWTAVASTIAATENKECLDLFIQLDGLSFINKWLKDAQAVNKNITDVFVDESIIALLRALEKLKIDNKRSYSSGIWITIKNLIEHSSTKIQDGARALFESWKLEDDCSRNCLDIEQDTHDKGTLETGKPASDSGKLDCSIPNAERLSPKSCQREEVGDGQIQTSGISSVADVKNESCGLSNPMHEFNPNEKDSLIVPSDEKIAPATCGNSVSKQDSKSSDIKELENKLSQERLNEAELSSSCNALEPGVASPDLDVGTTLVVTTKEETENIDKAILNPCTSQILKTQESACSTDALLKSSSKENNLKNSEGTLVSVMEDIRATDEEEHSSDGSENLAIFRFRGDDKDSNVADLAKSNIEIEYGIVDAIQVARQVAQEVEREVVDNKEPFCISSDREDSEVGFRQCTNPESLKRRYDLSTRPSDVLGRRNNSSVSSSEEDRSLINSKNINAEKEMGTHDMESSQLTEATQGPGQKVEKGLFVFDLNQEVSSDDMDFHPNHVSVPIPHVSGSKPAVISGSPGAPLQLGGTAAIVVPSASPHRTAGGDKPGCTEETQFSSRAIRNCLDIDLNATEGGDDALIQTQIPGSSSLRSAESSVEVSSKRPERLNLDLNRIDDDSEQLISNSRVERRPLLHLNGHSSPSPSSSSSSLQATKRNFDLNDRPLFQNDYSDRGLSSGKSSEHVMPLGKPKADPVISLFGKKVEVSRKDPISQSIPLINGKAVEPAVDPNMARAGGFLGMGSTMSYPHAPVWGYRGLASGAPISFAPPVYRPGSSVPYLVDPAVVPVLHQGMGSFMPVPSHSQPPFLMSMAGPPTLNGSIPQRPHFDLNSGYSIDGGSREPGVLRPYFVTDHGRSTEENWKASSQLSLGYGVGNKRKEAEGGFDSYPINFRQQQPPWK